MSTARRKTMNRNLLLLGMTALCVSTAALGLSACSARGRGAAEQAQSGAATGSTDASSKTTDPQTTGSRQTNSPDH
jgi:hypothetical protein